MNKARPITRPHARVAVFRDDAPVFDDDATTIIMCRDCHRLHAVDRALVRRLGEFVPCPDAPRAYPAPPAESWGSRFDSEDAP